MGYEDMKELMRILDNNNIDYEYGNYYGQELMSDGSYKEYINGHYIKLFGNTIDCWEIDDADDRWNRG
jgi:hypothetical protein